MSILLILLLIFFVISACLDYFRIQKEVKIACLSIAFMFLCFVVTFRYGVHDYDSYVSMFNDVPLLWGGGSYSDIHGEIGFLYLNSIIKSFGGSEILMFFVVAATTLALTFIFYRRYTKYYLIALLIYFSHVFLLREMIQIRSGLAVALVMFAIPHIYNRKFIPAFLIIFLASLFHSISWLFLLLYFLYPYLKSTRNQVIILVTGVVLGIIFTIDVLEKIMIMVGAPTLVLSYILDDQYNFSLGLLNPVLIKHIVVLIFIYKHKTVLEKKIMHFDVLLVSYVMAAFWLSTFNSFAIFSARIATMFSNVEHVLIPSLLYVTRYKRIVFWLVILYSLFSFFSKWDMLKSWTFSFSN